MAGITNIAFRRLCREQGAGLYVCEMVTTRALVERNPKTLRMIAFEPDERPRSLQLYGVDPEITAAAVRMVVGRGPRRPHRPQLRLPACPKVTRKGGGAALPWRRRLFARHRARRGRRGRAGRRPGHRQDAQGHRRRPPDVRRGRPDRAGGRRRGGGPARAYGRPALLRRGPTGTRSRRSSRRLDVPVLGNGDIWEADDALRMMAETGVRRRGGRPGLPRPAVAVRRPGGRVRRPAGARAAHARRGRRGDAPARRAAVRVAGAASADGCTDFRKHVAWYLKGFPVGSELRRALAMVVAAWPSWTTCWASSTRRAVPARDARPAARADELPGQGRSCRTAGWPTATPTRSPRAPSWTTPAADPGGARSGIGVV